MAAAESCDRCASWAAYRVTKGKHELCLCGVHARVLYQALKKGGWVFFPLGHKDIAPQGQRG